MPLYDYQCSSCGLKFEWQKGMLEPKPQCPACRDAVEQLYTAPAIKFVGPGFFVNDYPKS